MKISKFRDWAVIGLPRMGEQTKELCHALNKVALHSVNALLSDTLNEVVGKKDTDFDWSMVLVVDDLVF